MNNIDDNIFLKFIMNQMSHDELINVEENLLKAGEGSAILACTSSIWDTIHDALDIVGDITSKETLKKDRNNVRVDSIEVNKPQKESNMKQLTTKDGYTIKKITEAFNASMNDEVSLEENLMNFYMSQCPGVFPEEAESVITKIKEGVTTFDSALMSMISDNKFHVKDLTEKILEGKTLEEKYNYLINLLIAFQSLQIKNNFSNETFEQIKNCTYKAGIPVTEEIINEVIDQIEVLLDSGSLTLVSAEAINDLIKKAQAGEKDIKAFIADQESLFKQKMILSTAIMIGINNGEIENFVESEVSPQIIGAGVSSGLEQQKLMSELQSGKTSLDVALKILKYIGAAAILCASLYFGIAAIAGISGIFASWATTIIGLSVNSCIATWLVTGILVTLPLSYVYGDFISLTLDKAEDFYEWVINKIRRKSHDEISFIDWIKFKIERGEIIENNIEPEQSQTVLI